MNQLLLENINPVVLERLQILAQQHNRSLEDEIKAILEQVASTAIVEQQTESKSHGLPYEDSHVSSFSQAWAKIEAARQRHEGKIFSDSTELLREDRSR
ncbi:hypothetical protein IQ238_09310 [Pleurocapsales cyanobacterium LEGE 06147]|nr:hypothetical protein [Pleurocapsales cyanobacterium LEGE 06147]